MENSKSLELLFQYASTHQFEDFDRLFSELEITLPFNVFWEAYLMRTQIKLYTTNPTFIEDLEKASQAGKQPQFPLFSRIWRGDAPNRFIIFPKASGVLQGFTQSLFKAREKLAQWYGEQGHIFVRQIQGEICYFQGELQTALDLAEEQHRAEPKGHTDSIFTLCLLFRCHLALGQFQKAEQYMLSMIRLSKAQPECVAVYQSLRIWANITTSWNGDSPRFYQYPTTGTKLPVLEDRLESIRGGSPRTTSLEAPFVRYAEHSYEGAYPMRQYYMDLFHAMYWLSVRDIKQVESYFCKLYEIAVASGIVMPIFECGEQVIPLLKYIKERNMGYSLDWVQNAILRAEQYEEHLNLYRSLNI